MAYFKVCVRGKRKDNTYPIYIRVTHLRQVGYIKTNKVCKAKFVRNGDITDPYIIKDVYVQIETYLDRLNRVNTEGWGLERVMNFLKNDRDSISFSDFGREFILKMENEGRGRSAKNYLLALKSMESYFGNPNISFSDITSFFLKDCQYRYSHCPGEASRGRRTYLFINAHDNPVSYERVQIR